MNTIETNTPVRLSDQVSYEENNVVRREIFKTDAGSEILLLAFDAGMGLKTHNAPGDVMINVLEGEVKFDINGKEHFMQQGDSIFMYSGTPHSVFAKSRAKVSLTKF